MTAVYVISDLHFGHRNILKYRDCFSSIEEHDQTIMEGIRCLKKRDILWLLGDCFFTEDSIKFLEEINQYVSQVNWVLGNHDTDNKERLAVLRTIVGSGLVNKVGSMFKYGKHFWLTHVPMHPSELRGRANVHGHDHACQLQDSRYINTTCEALNYRPANMQSLIRKYNENT